ncbi:uncharacterized protein LOC121979965 [Zingiber officinale]|uniref:uncharacterized protein LOC121979965 n=1 Tax=Zingiber officinale TaxID=94328 RepID=UPI001C4D548A|nr:uncharacterized protein LOC121979965 [Zingiber officinale]
MNAPGNNQMIAPKIQTQLVNACAVETTNVILADLGDRWFTLLLDEAHDFHVATTTAACLKEAIDSLFAKYGLSVVRLRGQGYDGASNMSGEFNGLKSLIMKENSYALYVHCFVHQLQLVVVAIAQANQYVIDIILHEMDSRFSETTTDLLIYMSCLDLKNSFSRFDVQKLVRLAHFYEDDFSWNECMLVEQELETYIDDLRSDERFEGISDLGALEKKMIETMKNHMFPLVYRMIELALLLPVATATIERVFLTMNIVKTYLRNRIGDEWMNESLIIYIEKDVFNTVDNELILQHFQNMEFRSMQLSRIRL